MKFVKNMCFVMVLFLVSGCGFFKKPSSSPGLKAVQAQAIEAYDRGIHYLGQGRYLLAREQFYEAASVAVTEGLHDDAMVGILKVDTLLQNRRQYHD